MYTLQEFGKLNRKRNLITASNPESILEALIQHAPRSYVPSNKGDEWLRTALLWILRGFVFMITGVMAANYKLRKAEFFILIIKHPR